MDFNNILQDLEGNLDKYKPIPFWSWNDELSIERLCRQIDEMREVGLGGYIMHARGGLKTEYLSDKWMECIKACGDYGEHIGLDSWIYDENGWPSGFVGGKLLENENNRDTYLEYTIGDFDCSAKVSYLIENTRLTRVLEGKEDNTYLNVFIRISTSTVDILNADVVEQFIDHTHNAYKKYLKDDFSKKYRGFFTDEPQYYRWGTPYSHTLEKYFRDNFDEDIFDSLGLLFVEKEGYKTFRYRYWKSMQDLMLNNFAKKVYEWCDDNGVELTGHYIEETSLGYQMMCCAGVMPFYEFEHIPGIDWLGRWTDNELSIKQVASVASQLNKSRVLTEALGCCGWDVNFTELRRIVGFQFVGGVNLLCQHLFPYSEKGQRKRDYPAHFSSVNPLVKENMRIFNKFVTRLSCLISESEEKINVAVLHPIRSAYFDYKREIGDENGFGVEILDSHLKNDMRKLSSNGIAYHFIDETILAKHGQVQDTKIICGEKAYDFLILPHILTMDKSTECLLKKYISNGGKVFLMGDKPTYLEGEEHYYEYLNTNCSFEEILAQQPFSVSTTENELYYTYRNYNGTPFIFVQNASKDKVFKQKFTLDSKYHSFKKLNLENLEYTTISTEVSFEPSESVLLFPSEEYLALSEEYKEIKFTLNNNSVEFDKNNLTVDCVRYSKDGENFSKLYPIPALFQKLLEERFEGDIWFKYEFDIKILPKEIRIVFEETEKNEYQLNGQILEPKNYDDENYMVADIHKLVKLGANEFTMKTNWFQNEKVYYTLFGENITESLKNCLVYDSNIEAVYVEGKFGVYTDHPFIETEDGFVISKDFYIGEIPKTVTEPIKEGFPFFAGNMILHKNFKILDSKILLRLKCNAAVSDVSVNGKKSGKILFGELLDISDFIVKGENDIEISLQFSNRNKMGPHHTKDPLSHILAFPELFEISAWDDAVSPEYQEEYELLLLECDKK